MPADEPQISAPISTVAQRVLIAALLVVVSAAPGAFLAIGPGRFNKAGVIVGVAFWLVVFVALAASRWFDRRMRNQRTRRAVAAAIATRISLTLFPVCGVLDIWIGATLATAMRDMLNTLPTGFQHTLALSLLHGLFSVAVFGLLLGLLYGMMDKAPPEAPSGLCLVCGYDLRASPVRCPECGTPNPSATMPPPLAPLSGPSDNCP